MTPHKYRVRNVGYLSCEDAVVTSDPTGVLLVWTLASLTDASIKIVKPARHVVNAGNSRITSMVVYNAGADVDATIPEPDDGDKAPAAAAKADKSKHKAVKPAEAASEKAGKSKHKAGNAAAASAHPAAAEKPAREGKSKLKMSVAVSSGAGGKPKAPGAGAQAQATPEHKPKHIKKREHSVDSVRSKGSVKSSDFKPKRSGGGGGGSGGQKPFKKRK